MPASSKNEVQAAACSAYRTVEVSIGTATAVLRELSEAEMNALKTANFQKGPDGEFLTQKNPEDGEDYLLPVDEKPSRFAERWIAATITPAFTVEEIGAWPVSLKRRILKEAQAVNNIGTAAETAKNS